ncbi:LacI family transcriptional regulator [Variovorax sp. HW608]|uniref:LacI family DNA-binding transcriptional regulator n=1 Tax=Variovorax sp. HW608 TaxID=1034889 RepID=UPI00081FBE80|nr:LacI family DNA-binding transcriptional regulator [Variovorax sp. HW608]SCK17423.1 LacI family transcriptional regulator [Variovorax sp. HW608]
MAAVPTISEIARIAGVGTATVDRVLNRRPGVNAETVERVMQVVREMGAPPQPGRPRKGENFRFAYVLPAAEFPHLALIERQVAQSAGDFRHQHITEITLRIDASDPAAFADELSKLRDCQGIALLAPDLPPIKLAINELARSGVHVVTFFSDVAGSMRETHIGADNRAAGRTAGLLLARMAQAGVRDVLLLSSQATRISGEIERRIGFAQVLEERFPELRMVRTPDLPADDAGAADALTRFLTSEVELDRVCGIYNVGSASAGVVQALSGLGLVGRVGAIAHDLTDEHRALLSSGGLSYVLHQDIHYCVLTAARVLRALCENVRGALSVVQPRVEILTAENMD